MNESVSAILVRLCAFLIGIIAITVLFQLATTQSIGANSSDLFSTSADSPNVITSGMVTVAHRVGYATASTGTALGNGAQSSAHAVWYATGSAGRTVVHIADGGMRPIMQAMTTSVRYIGSLAVGAALFYLHSVGASISFVGRGLVGGTQFIGSVFDHIGGSVSNTSLVSSLIRPAEHAPVPTIDSPDVMTVATQHFVNAKATAVAPKPKAVSTPAPVPSPLIPLVAAPTAASAAAQWPIHGAITTLFGANDLPFELHHTGIDISDGKPAGFTPVKPFKPGKVIVVEHTDVSYGNHVIVDNGSGITSWYAHLNSTAVQVGQQVDENTVLGYEGDTGAATGVHLHFEIRLNNIPVNPQNFITGNP